MSGNGQGPTQPWEEELPELVWMTKVARAHVIRGRWAEKVHGQHMTPQEHVADLEALFVNGLMVGMLLYHFQGDFARNRLRELAAGTADAAFFMQHHKAQAAKVVDGDYS